MQFCGPVESVNQWPLNALDLVNQWPLDAVDLIAKTHCTYNRAARKCVRLQMKTNITLKLDSDLLRQVKILAAEDDISISAMLTERLEQMVRERETFARARKRALARLRQGMNLQWTPAHSRDELHER